VSPTKLQL